MCQCFTLPDVTRTAREISSLIENGIEREVRAGKRSFDELSGRIQAEVAAVVPEVRRRIAQAGIRLQDAAANISSALDSVRLRPAHEALDEANQYLQQYGSFRYYLFLILSGLVLIVTFCLVMGLFCGLCGRRPGNVYGDDTCNKGAGANFLLRSASGVPWKAEGHAVFPADELLPQLAATGFDLADVIRRCHQNQSIYTVLHLEPLYDLSELGRYKQQLGIDEQLDALRNQIQVDTDVEILTPLGKEQLYELARSDVARINYTAFTLTLEDRITAVELGQMGAALEAAANLLPPAERSAANRLRNQATILGAQQLVVDQMADIVVSLRVSRGPPRENEPDWSRVRW
ncbi:prominin-1-like [Pollicipes pollicipes]|uniref:prominin-1-like n=1 Tax=Pollicipes pollicipes TaxID=41117 RepID=UPI0018853FA7|nr:prominin-1-like [Pollicipes pollicipes]